MTELSPTIHYIDCGTTPVDLSFNVGDILLCRFEGGGGGDCHCCPLVWTDACLPLATMEEVVTHSTRDEDDDSQYSSSADYDFDDFPRGLLDYRKRGRKPDDDEIQVPRVVTNKMKQPLKTYAKLIKKLPFPSQSVSIEVSYDHTIHDELRKGNPSPMKWHSVRYLYWDKKSAGLEMVYARQDKREWMQTYEERSVEDIVKYYLYHSAYICVRLFGEATLPPIVPRGGGRVVLQSDAPKLPLCKDWEAHDIGIDIALVGPACSLRRQLTYLHEHYWPNSFNYSVSRRDDSDVLISNHRLVKSTWARPAMYFNLMLDIYLVLLDRCDLGPYVLLEIIDWLPRMDLISHHAKINYLQQIWTSVYAIRERRWNREIKHLCL